MQISLRKANAVQAGINDVMKNINFKTSIELNEFQDVETELVKANTELFANDARRQKLLLALYNIRGLVGAANAQSGIDMKLATAAFLDKRLAQLETVSKLEPVTDIAVIKGKLDKIRNDKSETARSRIYGYNDSVTTSIVSQDQINQAKAEIQNLKKQKQKVNDEVLELNIKTEIPLTDDVVATLQAEGLI
jgi:uncharacterized protein YdcH (DUF465 family)